MKITLRNDFHNTEAVVIPHNLHGREGFLSARQVKRADRKLCGMSDCTCGGITRDVRFEYAYSEGSGFVEVDK